MFKVIFEHYSKGKWDAEILHCDALDLTHGNTLAAHYTDPRHPGRQHTDYYEPVRNVRIISPKFSAGICDRCGSVKPVGQSCGCFDNGCE